MSPGTAASQRPREGTKRRVSCREPCGLMKPAVEKQHGDRINRSIVQLKGLLEREFHSEPNCRLEKAEILERCVSFLRHHRSLASRPPRQGYDDGYIQCLQEALGVVPELLPCPLPTPPQTKPLSVRFLRRKWRLPAPGPRGDPGNSE